MKKFLEREGISDSAGKGNPKGCCYAWADMGQAITHMSLRRNEPQMTVVVKRKYDDSSANQICLEGKSPKEREAQEKLLVQKKKRECAKNHEFVPGGFTLKGLSVGMSRYQVEEQLKSRGFQCEVDLGGSIIGSLIGKLSKVCTKEKKENSSGLNLLHSASNLIQFTFDNDETGCALKLSAISFGSGILNLGNMTVREVAQALVDSGKTNSMQYVASEDGFCSERGDKGDRICVTMASGIVFTKIDGANFNKGGPSFD